MKQSKLNPKRYYILFAAIGNEARVRFNRAYSILTDCYNLEEATLLARKYYKYDLVSKVLTEAEFRKVGYKTAYGFHPLERIRPNAKIEGCVLEKDYQKEA